MKEALLGYGRKLAKRGPWAVPVSRIRQWIRRRGFSSSEYWERRYAEGGDSGVGSFGVLAQYKADVLNRFVEREGIESVVEFGCGDGNQLSLYRFPCYLGLDVSQSAIGRCEGRFSDDASKRFLLYPVSDPSESTDAELAISIDVIYHLVEEDVLFAYLRDLFASARRYVVIYSTDFDCAYDSPHQVDRRISTLVRSQVADFEQVATIINPHKGGETMSDFFVYKRIESTSAA